MKTYRMDVDPDRLVTRHFRLESPHEAALEATLPDVLALAGVQDVTWDAKEQTLSVLYDAGVENVDAVRGTLRRHGLDIHEDWHSRLSETLWRFEDSLMRASRDRGPRHTLER